MVAETNINLCDFEGCLKLIESIDTNELDWLKVTFLVIESWSLGFIIITELISTKVK